MKYQTAVQNLKTANHQYAKRQVSWIRNKLLPTIRASKSSEGTEIVEMYLLDATEPQRWATDVSDVARSLMEAFLKRETLPDPLTISSVAQRMLSVPIKATDPTAVLLARRKTLCPVCTVDEALPVMIERSEWEAHARSKVHRRLSKRAERRQPAQGKGDGTHGDIGNPYDPTAYHDGLFGT